MNQLIDQIAEIEAAAKDIMDKATEEKKALKMEMEAEMKAFDDELEEATRQTMKEMEKDFIDRTLAEKEKITFARTSLVNNIKQHFAANQERYVSEIMEQLLKG